MRKDIIDDRVRIEVTDLDKYELLAALCNNTKAIGMGRMDEKAFKVIGVDDCFDEFNDRPDGPTAHFDNVFGRPVKLWFTVEDGKMYLDRWWLYDRDSDKKAIDVVKELRDGL